MKIVVVVGIIFLRSAFVSASTIGQLQGAGVSDAEAMTNVGVPVDECCRIYSELSALHDDYGRRFPREVSIREDWDGVMLSTNRHYNAIRQAVTNHWRESLLALSSITNQGDRLIVIASGVANDEAEYLARVDAMADMVLSNKVSTFELRYFGNRCSVYNRHAESVLLRRYTEPSISNLIMKVYSAGGIPDGVEAIFSGQEQLEFNDYATEGMLD